MKRQKQSQERQASSPLLALIHGGIKGISGRNNKAIEDGIVLENLPLPLAVLEQVRVQHLYCTKQDATRRVLQTQIELYQFQEEILQTLAYELVASIRRLNQEVSVYSKWHHELAADLTKQSLCQQVSFPDNITIMLGEKNYSQDDLASFLEQLQHKAKAERQEITDYLKHLALQINEAESDMSLMHASMVTVRKTARKMHVLALDGTMEASGNHQEIQSLHDYFDTIQALSEQVSDQLYEVNDCLVQVMSGLSEVTEKLQPMIRHQQPAFLTLCRSMDELIVSFSKNYKYLSSIFNDYYEIAKSTAKTVDDQLDKVEILTQELDQLETIRQMIDVVQHVDISGLYSPNAVADMRMKQGMIEVVGGQLKQNLSEMLKHKASHFVHQEETLAEQSFCEA